VNRQAVILAGGMGTRLGSLTESIPKPVLPVGGEPFINYLIWNLARHGITDIIVSSGYQHAQMVFVMETHPVPGVEVRFVQEATPLGTGGGLRNCLSLLEEQFFVLNGDSIFELNYLDLAMRASTGAAIGLREVEDTARYGRVDVATGLVTSFREKGDSGPGFINSGIYCLSRGIVEEMPEGECSLERDVFPRLVAENRLAAGFYSGFFIDIGIPEDFERAQTEVPAWKRKGALFLDRDGVLNINYGYVHSWEKWTWCAGAKEAIKFVNDNGLLVILVTNQSGIGRGYYDTETFNTLMCRVQEDLAEIGAHMDGIYHCPHHPEAGIGRYKQACDCRKPGPGMLMQALSEWDIDLERSLMIGDSPKDIEAGERAGVTDTCLFDPEKMNLLECIRGSATILGLAVVPGE